MGITRYPSIAQASVGDGPSVVSVEDYGARTDLTDNQVAMQAACTAVGSAGGGFVDVPAGAWMLSGRLDIPAGVTLRGRGIHATTLRSTVGAASQPMIRLRGDNDVTLTNLTVDLNSRSNSIGIVSEPAVTTTVATRHTVRGCRVRNAANTAIRAVNPVLDFTVEDNTIEDCASGGILLLQVPTQGRGIRIVGNRIRRVGGVNIQLAGTTQGAFAGVLIADNDLRDFTVPTVAIPIEGNYSDGIVIRGNTIGSAATRGISTGNNRGITIADNTIRDQSVYAVELGNDTQFAVTGNVATGCASLCHSTFSTPVEDGVIAGNVYYGSGLLSTVAGDVIKLHRARRVKVVGNIIRDWQFLRSAVRVGEAEATQDVTVEGNTFVCSDVNSPISAVVVRLAVRTVVRGNTVVVSRDLVAGDAGAAAVSLVMDAASSAVTVEHNDVRFTGTTTAAANASGIGNNDATAAALAEVVVRGNRVVGGRRGLRLLATSTDLVAADNDTRTCTDADVIPTTAAVTRTARLSEGTAAPTTGTWRTGDFVRNTAPVSGTLGWVCTVAGSPGTWVAMPIV